MQKFFLPLVLSSEDFFICLLVFRPCHPLKSRQNTSTLLTLDLKFKRSQHVNAESTFRRFKQFKQIPPSITTQLVQ